jgi:hypothetical protein
MHVSLHQESGSKSTKGRRAEMSTTTIRWFKSGFARALYTVALLLGLAAPSMAANAAPTVATPASASPSPALGKTTVLSVLGADDGGQAALVYKWRTTGFVAAEVKLSVDYDSTNGTNSASSTTATFTQTGFYNFEATITDAYGLSVISTVGVEVRATFTDIVISPNPVYVNPGTSRALAAIARDQFTNALPTQPTFSWSVGSGGSIGAGTGMLSAGTTTGGPHTVTCTSGGKSAQAPFYVQRVAPVAFSQSVQTAMNQPLPLVLTARDDNADTLTFTIVSNPLHGTLTGTGSNRTYTPTASYTGPDSFSFKVNDSFADSNVGVITIGVHHQAAYQVAGITPLVAPAAFDPYRWINDPAYKNSYLQTTEPGRVWQAADGAAGVPILKPSGSAYLSGTVGSALSLSVLGAINAPVTFTCFGEGYFATSLGRRNTVTVQANATGMAQLQFMPVRIGKTAIMAGSPLASGRVRFLVSCAQ